MSEKIEIVVKMLKREAQLLVEALLLDNDLMKLDCTIYNHLENLKKTYYLLRAYNVSVQLSQIASDLGMDQTMINELKEAGFPSKKDLSQ